MEPTKLSKSKNGSRKLNSFMILLGLFWMRSHVKIKKRNKTKKHWRNRAKIKYPKKIRGHQMKYNRKSKKYSPCHPQKRQFPKIKNVFQIFLIIGILAALHSRFLWSWNKQKENHTHTQKNNIKSDEIDSLCMKYDNNIQNNLQH